MQKKPFSRHEKLLLLIAALLFVIALCGLTHFFKATPSISGPENSIPGRWIPDGWIVLMFSAVLIGLFLLFRPKRFQPPELDFPRILPDLVPETELRMRSGQIDGYRLAATVIFFGGWTWLLAFGKCETGFSCSPDQTPALAIMILSVSSLDIVFLHRLRELIRPYSPTSQLNLSHYAYPALGKRIAELGGIYDYEAHAPRLKYGPNGLIQSPTYVVLTRDALLLVHFAPEEFARREVQEFSLADGVSMRRCDAANIWRIDGRVGPIFELHCAGCGGQRLADTLAFLKHGVRPQLTVTGRGLPVWPGSLIRLHEVLLLAIAPLLWLLGGGAWYSLALLLSLTPIPWLFINHHLLVQAYKKRTISPLTEG